MDLGAFSVSLAVKDIHASKSFYEQLGFQELVGDLAQNWLIMKNGEHAIGLFQGMFEKNLLTFNPGWDQSGAPVESFTDVRDLQRELKAKGITPTTEADENSTGPASFMVVDPDGNPILIDQHV
jgi:catechol 2,3-dioxygenase-like lactoylglutathione lyase family enzyme